MVPLLLVHHPVFGGRSCLGQPVAGMPAKQLHYGSDGAVPTRDLPKIVAGNPIMRTQFSDLTSAIGVLFNATHMQVAVSLPQYAGRFTERGLL